MEKLYKYMDKVGATYQRVHYGSNYFYNVAPVEFPGAIVSYDIHDDDERTAARKVSDYCARNGYTVFRRGGYPGYGFFSVMDSNEKAELDFLTEYVEQSAAACEKAMHLRNLGHFASESNREFNDRLRGIMDYYGEQYTTAKAAKIAG